MDICDEGLAAVKTDDLTGVDWNKFGFPIGVQSRGGPPWLQLDWFDLMLLAAMIRKRVPEFATGPHEAKAGDVVTGWAPAPGESSEALARLADVCESMAEFIRRREGV